MIFNFYTSIYVPKKIFMFLRNVCIILAIIFVVLLIVLIVLLTRKPEKAEEFEESYY